MSSSSCRSPLSGAAATALIDAAASSSSPRRAPPSKHLLLIRHGESEFNAAMRWPGNWLNPFFYWRGCDPGLRDPFLTARGKSQARKGRRRLAEEIEKMMVRQNEKNGKSDHHHGSSSAASSSDKNIVFFTSPMQRAMQTGLLMLGNELETSTSADSTSSGNRWFDTGPRTSSSSSSRGPNTTASNCNKIAPGGPRLSTTGTTGGSGAMPGDVVVEDLDRNSSPERARAGGATPSFGRVNYTSEAGSSPNRSKNKQVPLLGDAKESKSLEEVMRKHEDQHDEDVLLIEGGQHQEDLQDEDVAGVRRGRRGAAGGASSSSRETSPSNSPTKRRRSRRSSWLGMAFDSIGLSTPRSKRNSRSSKIHPQPLLSQAAGAEQDASQLNAQSPDVEVSSPPHSPELLEENGKPRRSITSTAEVRTNKMYALPAMRERCKHLGDLGTPVEDLEKQYDKVVDFSLIPRNLRDRWWLPKQILDQGRAFVHKNKEGSGQIQKTRNNGQNRSSSSNRNTSKVEPAAEQTGAEEEQEDRSFSSSTGEEDFEPEDFEPALVCGVNETERELVARVAETKAVLLARQESQLVLFGHSIWFKTLLGPSYRKMKNGELVSCILHADGTVSDVAFL